MVFERRRWVNKRSGNSRPTYRPQSIPHPLPNATTSYQPYPLSLSRRAPYYFHLSRVMPPRPIGRLMQPHRDVTHPHQCAAACLRLDVTLNPSRWSPTHRLLTHKLVLFNPYAAGHFGHFTRIPWGLTTVTVENTHPDTRIRIPRTICDTFNYI